MSSEQKQQPIYSVVRDRSQDLLQVCGGPRVELKLARSGRTKARSSRLATRSSGLAAQDVGDLTAGVPPVPIPNTEVKPRWADCTARESVWESRSLPA